MFVSAGQPPLSLSLSLSLSRTMLLPRPPLDTMIRPNTATNLGKPDALSRVCVGAMNAEAGRAIPNAVTTTITTAVAAAAAILLCTRAHARFAQLCRGRPR